MPLQNKNMGYYAKKAGFLFARYPCNYLKDLYNLMSMVDQMIYQNHPVQTKLHIPALSILIITDELLHIYYWNKEPFVGSVKSEIGIVLIENGNISQEEQLKSQRSTILILHITLHYRISTGWMSNSGFMASNVLIWILEMYIDVSPPPCTYINVV